MNLESSNRLTDLAERIRASDSAMRKAERNAASAAIDTGFLLTQAKDDCQHGQWLPFLAAAGVAERQAQRLMQLARSGLTSDTVSDLGVKAALALVGKRKLPQPGQVLAISVGEGHQSDWQNFHESTVWIWESDEAPGSYHLASTNGAPNGEPTALSISVPGDPSEVVFMIADKMLEHRYAQMRFKILVKGDLLARLGELRQSVLAA